jgi:hypothetical protein
VLKPCTQVSSHAGAQLHACSVLLQVRFEVIGPPDPADAATAPETGLVPTITAVLIASTLLVLQALVSFFSTCKAVPLSLHQNTPSPLCTLMVATRAF